MRRYNCNV